MWNSAVCVKQKAENIFQQNSYWRLQLRIITAAGLEQMYKPILQRTVECIKLFALLPSTITSHWQYLWHQFVIRGKYVDHIFISFWGHWMNMLSITSRLRWFQQQIGNQRLVHSRRAGHKYCSLYSVSMTSLASPCTLSSGYDVHLCTAIVTLKASQILYFKRRQKSDQVAPPACSRLQALIEIYNFVV